MRSDSAPICPCCAELYAKCHDPWTKKAILRRVATDTDPVNRLLPSDTAKLTAEMRSADEVRKPCLVELERLFEVALGEVTTPGSPIALTIIYADLGSWRFKVEYSVEYRCGIKPSDASPALTSARHTLSASGSRSAP